MSVNNNILNNNNSCLTMVVDKYGNRTLCRSLIGNCQTACGSNHGNNSSLNPKQCVTNVKFTNSSPVDTLGYMNQCNARYLANLTNLG